MSVQSIFPDPERRRGSRDYAGPVLELFHENEVGNQQNISYFANISAQSRTKSNCMGRVHTHEKSHIKKISCYKLFKLGNPLQKGKLSGCLSWQRLNGFDSTNCTRGVCRRRNGPGAGCPGRRRGHGDRRRLGGQTPGQWGHPLSPSPDRIGTVFFFVFSSSFYLPNFFGSCCNWSFWC